MAMAACHNHRQLFGHEAHERDLFDSKRVLCCARDAELLQPDITQGRPGCVGRRCPLERSRSKVPPQQRGDPGLIHTVPTLLLIPLWTSFSTDSTARISSDIGKVADRLTYGYSPSSPGQGQNSSYRTAICRGTSIASIATSMACTILGETVSSVKGPRRCCTHEWHR